MSSEYKRVKLDIPLSNLEKALETVSLFTVIAVLAVQFILWKDIPNNIPTHFGPSGTPDAWGGKGSLIMLPFVEIGLYILLTVVGKFPHAYNYIVEITEQNARYQYQNARTLISWLKADLVIVFGYIQYKTIQVALGRASGLGAGFVLVFLLVLFGTVGYYIVRMLKRKKED